MRERARGREGNEGGKVKKQARVEKDKKTAKVRTTNGE